MTTSSKSQEDKEFTNRVVEAAIHIGIIFVLIAWCFQIFKPFLTAIVWGFIIAVAFHPLYHRMQQAFNGYNRLIAVLFTISLLLLLIIPTVMLGASLVETVKTVIHELESGQISVPAPPESVATWPLIGEKLSAFWTLASENLTAAIEKLKDHFKGLGEWLLGAGLVSVFGLLQFIFAIIISGILLAYSRNVESNLRAVAHRIAGDFGEELTDIANATIRSVAVGVVGVAIIQSLLAGIGLLAMNIHGAGLWTLLILLLAVMQITPIIILGPIMVYVFSTADITPAILFAIWSILVTISDGLLKPLLLGRGVDIPMPIILIGALGGMITAGIIGLFIGAVVLAFGYKLFLVWLQQDAATSAE